MAATTVTDAGSVRIITEVIPATDPRAAQLASGSQTPAPARTSFQTQGFRRAHPKVLGTIHIFTGIVHICFGIILTASEHRNPSLPVASGILFWLGILLLVSGSLLVESERRDSPVLVRSRLGGTTCPPIPYVPSSSCRDPSTAWIHPTGSTGQSPPQEVPSSPTWSTGQGLGSLWDEGDGRSRRPSWLLESLWDEWDKTGCLLQEFFDPSLIIHVGSSPSRGPCHRVLPAGQDLLRGQRGHCPGHAGGHWDPRHGRHPARARLREPQTLPDAPGMVPQHTQQEPEQRAGFHLRAPRPPGILRGRGGAGVWIRRCPAAHIHPAGAVAMAKPPHVPSPRVSPGVARGAGEGSPRLCLEGVGRSRYRRPPWWAALPGTKMAALPGTKMAALPGTKMAAAAVRGGCCPLQKWRAGSPGAFSGERDSDAISRRRRVDHGGGERGQPGIGTGSDPRGAQRGRRGSGRGSEAAERRQEAAGGGGGHPAGQAQVGTGVEGSREKEVLPHDPGQGAPQLLGTENEGEAGEEDGPGSGTAAGGGEAEGERGKEAAAGGKPEAAPGKRAESRDCPSDPEPPEAQAGQEEAAEAGGKAGYAGPAPEDACEAKQGHGMRRESGSCSFPGTFPRLCQDLQCQTNNRAELGGCYSAGTSCWIPQSLWDQDVASAGGWNRTLLSQICLSLIKMNRCTMVEVTVTPQSSLADRPVQIRVQGLSPSQLVTLRAWLKDEQGECFQSRAFFRADGAGEVDPGLHAALGGSYSGVWPMGLLWFLQPDTLFRRLVKRDVAGSPFRVRLEVFDGLSLGPDPKEQPLASCEAERWYVGPGVQRVPIREGRVRGALFLPPGPGPFPGVIDLFGGAGGLIEFRAGLLASRGFAVLALAFFAYDDLPRVLAQLDLEYFEEAVELLLQHPKVRGPGLGVVGVSKGAEVALAMAAFLPRVVATVWINGTAFLHGNPLVYKELRIPPIPYYTERVLFTELGAMDNSAIFADPRDPTYRTSAIPVEKIQGKVLFVVGEADRSFNSKLFAELALARMPPESGRILSYPGAGHLIEPPGSPLCSTSSIRGTPRPVAWGGEPQPHARAQEDSWREILQFLELQLGSVAAMKL